MRSVRSRFRAASATSRMRSGRLSWPFVESPSWKLRRVEEGDATVESGTDELNGSLLFGRRPIAIAEAHAAETDGRDFETAFAKCVFLHCFLLGWGV
jgi:hypothetical protein